MCVVHFGFGGTSHHGFLNFLTGLNHKNCSSTLGGRFSVDNKVTCHNITSNPHVKTNCSSKLLVSGNLNYESETSHEIIVEVSDGNHSKITSFTITILDKNDPPENVTVQGSLSCRVKENANDELIGELVTRDEDPSQIHTYALKNSPRFTIKGSKLYSSGGANLNYERQQEFEIVVVSTDSGSPQLNVEQNLTVVVSYTSNVCERFLRAVDNGSALSGRNEWRDDLNRLFRRLP